MPANNRSSIRKHIFVTHHLLFVQQVLLYCEFCGKLRLGSSIDRRETGKKTGGDQHLEKKQEDSGLRGQGPQVGGMLNATEAVVPPPWG